jgi:hypothetical protein
LFPIAAILQITSSFVASISIGIGIGIVEQMISWEREDWLWSADGLMG